MEIRNIEILHATIPLKEPYILSFARIIEIDSIVVRITLENGGVGYSEAVPLLGYSNETKETIIENSIKVIKLIHKLDTSELESFLDEIIPNASFVISAFITAKEMALKQFSIEKEITALEKTYDDLEALRDEIEDGKTSQAGKKLENIP